VENADSFISRRRFRTFSRELARSITNLWATELNQAAAVGQAVKAVVNAILDALVAGEAVRVAGLGSFDVAARPARYGRNPQTGEAIKIAASKAVRFHAGKAVKDALNPPTAKAPRKNAAPPKKSAVRK
jgi:DNA-binding protein HU-beta